MKKKELEYQIEALQDQVEDLEQQLQDQHAKLWSIIQENDRLTLKYEPYRPEGDEHENLDFYGLVEDNKKLKDLVKRLQEKNNRLVSELIDVRKAITETKVAKEHKPLIKYTRWWNANIELWPGAWDLNYYRYKWEKYGSDSREGSLQFGPFGFSWNREPKKA